MEPGESPRRHFGWRSPSSTVLVMFRSSLLLRGYGRFALSSFTQGCLKASPSLTKRTLTHQLSTLSNCTYGMLCTSVQSQRKQILQLGKACILMQLTRQCSKVPLFYFKERDLNNEIMSKTTVQDHLEFYQKNKNHISLINRITLLHCIAKITHKYQEEKEVLQQEKEKVKHGKESAYFDILDFISENISSCKAQGLANMMWSLGRIGEETHSLVRVCEEEILCHDFALFHPGEICQILTGCAALGLKDSPVFERAQESILKEIIRISMCETRQISGILLAFTKVGCGSAEFFDRIEYEIVRRGFKAFHNGEIAQCLYTFASRGIYSPVLFEKAEEEILRRSATRIRRKDMVMMLWSFATAAKGSEELFTTFGKEIASNRLKELYNIRLIWVIWSFATREIANSEVYKAIAMEVCRRGLQTLTNRELSLCMYSYALSEIPLYQFLEKLGTEMLARDLASFEGDQLGQVVWACGKAGLTNPELFCHLEEGILRLSFSKNQASMIYEGFCIADMGSKELLAHLDTMMQQSQ